MTSFPDVGTQLTGLEPRLFGRLPGVDAAPWGYAIKDRAARPLRLSARSLAAWAVGVVLTDIALGVWLLGPLGLDPAPLVLKLGASLACAALAWQFFVLANADGPRELQMDRRKRQARVLLRRRAGRPLVIVTLRLSDLCAFTLRPVAGSGGARSALMLMPRGGTAVEILRGPTLRLEPLRLRLEMDRALWAGRRPGA
ncbi:hypothetical protein [Pseudoroseicyclus aestuarii]|uniref:Uncharacterized protein n=1 Tax=Pseudoroseicyclus aestuarii TaxID=1795041 RepID=A0A318SVR4_9RHOB|nr:hypothetical protein [Pseudoroseicyclus aestuarii]PYE85940.1 hypothetical protein DFP88_101614 [Pseudoroseicyclus aestuarii]